MILAAGMHLVAGKAGDSAFSRVKVVEIAAAVTETGCLSGLLIHQCPVVALEAESNQGNFQKLVIRRSVRCMAAETVVINDRRMYALLAGLVVVTLITEPGGPVLYLGKTVIDQVVAVGELVTRGAAVSVQGAVSNGTTHFTEVTPVARFAAEWVDRPFGRSENAGGLRGDQKECDRDGEDDFKYRWFHRSPAKNIVI